MIIPKIISLSPMCSPRRCWCTWLIFSISSGINGPWPRFVIMCSLFTESIAFVASRRSIPGFSSTKRWLWTGMDYPRRRFALHSPAMPDGHWTISVSRVWYVDHYDQSIVQSMDRVWWNSITIALGKHARSTSASSASERMFLSRLDACIGGRNYFYFIRVITFGTVALWIWYYRAIQVISTDVEQYTAKYLFLEHYDPWFNYILFITTFNTFWVTLMTIFHLYNSIVLGVTLNERLTGFRYSYFRDENTGTFHNPFRHALFKNFLETFGLFRLMAFFRYTRVDWSQIYDINQIRGPKNP